MTEFSAARLNGHFTIPPDHPALAGHFPGHPIVPGVILLQRVMDLLAAGVEAPAAMRLANVKFLAPLRPREVCTIAVHPRAGAGGCRFECSIGPVVIARGDILTDSGV